LHLMSNIIIGNYMKITGDVMTVRAVVAAVVGVIVLFGWRLRQPLVPESGLPTASSAV
jgi:hypothetical protein